jgi:hypothetical protein
MPADGGVVSLPDYSARAAEGYSRLVAQCQQLLYRIYRGEVSPATLQAQVPSLVQQRGAEYQLALSRLSVDLFSSLLDLGRAYRDEMFRALLPEAPDFRSPYRPEHVPATGDWTQTYQTISARLVQEQTESLAQYQLLLRRMAAGELTAESTQQRLRAFVEDRAADYARRTAELSATFFDGLFELNQRCVEDIFRQLVPEAPVREQAASTLSLSLTGTAGTTVSASMTVENTEASRSHVFCSIAEFRNTDGSGRPFTAPCDVEPAEFWLEPGETAQVTVRLDLKPDLFPSGRTYASTLLIRGSGGEDTLVFLIAGATAP